MKWLDKILKPPSHHRVVEVEYDSRCDTSYGTHWGLDAHPKQLEDEELDHAIALSLSGEGRQKMNGNMTTQGDLDEELAKALHASLNVDELFPWRNSPFSIPFLRTSDGQRLCEGCRNAIGHGRYLSCMNAVWHPQCFRCYGCDLPISDPEFCMSGNNPFHRSCYKELFHPRCDICKQFIPMNADGLIEYRVHPFWGQKYCPTHERDAPRCCSCERVKAKDAEYVSLEDGRKLCLECLHLSVMDTGECQPLYHEIRDFYEGLNMKIEQQIPILLVERQALNEAMVGEKEGYHHMPETRGLCLSEEQTVNIIHRRPRIGFGNRLIGLGTESQRLTRQCQVTAILVLYGLPRLLTGSILAHELMHAWLRLNGFRNIPPEVEEGICQVLAHMWLESEAMAGSSSSTSSSSRKPKRGRSQIEKKLGEFFLYQIASDTSPVYGEGFRAGQTSMAKYGLRRTLDHIKLTSRFPI